MKAYVFPGQGSQFSGMGFELYSQQKKAKDLFHRANEVLGFEISHIMFEGTEDELKQTKVTQPAIFLHSTILASCLADRFTPAMVAGHSLGEFSALVASQAISFEDGLSLVSQRALAMQEACESISSTMAAVLGLEDEVIENICAKIDGVVVPANYNCPGQLVISGSTEAVQTACEKLLEAGAKRALLLPVGGAFHSPLMEPAREKLAKAIESTAFKTPICPIYQNVDAQPTIDPLIIKENLLLQLTAPVRWTQTMENMSARGLSEVIEVGPGKVLQGLFKKINRDLPVSSATID
ncbi:MAG: ACP S-malonyltransferase [Crocinitomicaceae bacterium]|jgi:[acyl-carrier-protein] S-malonyltransferase